MYWLWLPDDGFLVNRNMLEQKWVPGVFPGGKGSRCLRLTTLPPSCTVVMKSGNLNFLEPSGPLQVCNGIALPLPNRQLTTMKLHEIKCGLINRFVWLEICSLPVLLLSLYICVYLRYWSFTYSMSMQTFSNIFQNWTHSVYCGNSVVLQLCNKALPGCLLATHAQFSRRLLSPTPSLV